VLVLGATNRPDRLDPALLRPGRFDLTLNIPLPEHPARVAIARIALRDKPHAADVTPEVIADRTEGCSGAEVQAVCTRAALAAVREVLGSNGSGQPADPRITLAHLDEALASVEQSRPAH
jgi:transitional endoplasmic reticulum ATPase